MDRKKLAPISPLGHERSTVDRQILGLAVPALGALVAEPLLVLADSAIVGRLGTTELAGLSLASTLLVTVVGLCVFLAYATTAAVARRSGAGDRAGAMQMGVDGLWLALGLGVLLAATALVVAPWAVSALGADGAVAEQAVLYLRSSAPGLPGMLLVLAATGALRGLQDTRTPLVVAATGAAVNVVLNVVLVYGAGWGIVGSGAGTAAVQIGMGAWLAVVVVRGARSAGASLRPAVGGVVAGIRAGTPLLLRTLSLRAAILLTVWVATGLGPVALAGHQVVNAVWGFVAFALDALAIAAQALIGTALGAADVPRVRALLRRTLQWGVGAGAVLGLGTAAIGWWLSAAFTSDPDVRHAITVALVVTGVLMPMAGWVFVLDGVLIGAGDGRYLAAVGLVTLAAYVPVALAVRAWAPEGWAGLAWLWAAFAGVFMLARAVTTGLRARGDRWLVTGA
ncbi:MATE family efflux transporter [Cellulomonas triticagri]|uniref:MATE family efflux transporter n=1 Tax=Cellulomonas triticagri TaxID=2483352 RepID=A0A3M2J4V0_9CELL|nr:MATE family efflux transporter [Cellulomonas triticagri]RMI09112.1 MATE family efflux transporter [Cellulomonas triticagri]